MWKIIEHFNNYSVSQIGQIKNNKTGKILSPSISPNGYLKVILRKNNISYTRSIHRLVAEAFVSNSENKETVNHIDGNKLNNTYSNLEWLSYRKNMEHAITTGLRKDLGEGSKNAKLTTHQVVEILNLAKEDKLKNKEIAKQFNISSAYVSQIIKNKRWGHLNQR